MYPISVHIANKKVVVIGAGKIAYFKIGPLVEEGADVIVISPQADEKVQELARDGKVTWLKREYKTEDLQDAFLVIAATDNHEVNEKIWREADRNQLVNVISNPNIGNTHIPAALKRGKLMIAVSTGGASPKLAKKIRNDLALQYDESYEEYLDFLNECRVRLKQSDYPKAERHQLLQEVLKDEYRISPEKRADFLNRLP
ncbi:MAG: NAD(P)-binding protein [Ectobacillus sp.]